MSILADNENISTTDFSLMVKHIDNHLENIDYDDSIKELF